VFVKCRNLAAGGSGYSDGKEKGGDRGAVDNTVLSEVDGLTQWLVKGRPYKSLHSGRVLYDMFNRS
jgi:hypothetical protein